MDETTFQERLLAEVQNLAAALVDQSRALEALAVAVQKQGRQGTLRVRIEAPQPKRRKKVRSRT